MRYSHGLSSFIAIAIKRQTTETATVEANIKFSIMTPIVSHYPRVSAISEKTKLFPVCFSVRLNKPTPLSYNTGIELEKRKEYDDSQKKNPQGKDAILAEKINTAFERMKAIVYLLDPYLPNVFGYIVRKARKEDPYIFIDTKIEFDAHKIASRFVNEYNRTNPGAKVCSIREKDKNGNYSMVPAALTKYAGEVQSNLLPVEKMQKIVSQAQEIVGKNGEKMIITNGENGAHGSHPTQMQVLIQNTFNITAGSADGVPLIGNSNYNPDSDLLKWMMDSMKKSNEGTTVEAYVSAQRKLIRFLVLSERLKLEKLEEGSQEPYVHLVESQSKLQIADATKYKVPHISFKDLNYDIVEEFEKWMITDGKGSGKGMRTGTTKTYLSYIKSAYKLAEKKGIIKNEENAFEGFKMYEPGKVDRCLTEEQLKAVMEHEPEKPKMIQSGKKLKDGGRKIHFSTKEARGYWMYSLLSYGMNMKDIALLKYGKLTEESFGFIRSKTRKRVKTVEDIIVPIHTYHREFIQEYGNKDKDPDNYVFPILKKGILPKPRAQMTTSEILKWDKQERMQINRTVNNFVTQVNRYMRKIAEALDFDPKRFTTYSARHTFTNRARAFMDDYMIAKKLGHKGGSITILEKHYLNAEDKNQATSINNELTKFMNGAPEEKKVSEKVPKNKKVSKKAA